MIHHSFDLYFFPNRSLRLVQLCLIWMRSGLWKWLRPRDLQINQAFSMDIGMHAQPEGTICSLQILRSVLPFVFSAPTHRLLQQFGFFVSVAVRVSIRHCHLFLYFFLLAPSVRSYNENQLTSITSASALHNKFFISSINNLFRCNRSIPL